jgi:HSP20 family protein
MIVKRSSNQFYPSIFDVIFNSNNIEKDYNVNRPAYNISEENAEFIIEMAVPGFEKENFKVEVNKDLLEVSAERKLEAETESKELKYFYKGFSCNNFKKSFSLPEDINKENISANYENGILKVVIPKEEKERISKQIQIL